MIRTFVQRHITFIIFLPGTGKPLGSKASNLTGTLANKLEWINCLIRLVLPWGLGRMLVMGEHCLWISGDLLVDTPLGCTVQ
jgi:hypothetical protein